MSESVKDKLIGTVVTIVTMLLSFLAYSFVSSLASKSTVELYRKDNVEKYKELKKEVKSIHRALCFVDERTCKFFE
jgi:hypothetical protein